MKKFLPVRVLKLNIDIMYSIHVEVQIYPANENIFSQAIDVECYFVIRVIWSGLNHQISHISHVDVNILKLFIASFDRVIIHPKRSKNLREIKLCLLMNVWKKKLLTLTSYYFTIALNGEVLLAPADSSHVGVIILSAESPEEIVLPNKSKFGENAGIVGRQGRDRHQHGELHLG